MKNLHQMCKINSAGADENHGDHQHAICYKILLFKCNFKSILVVRSMIVIAFMDFYESMYLTQNLPSNRVVMCVSFSQQLALVKSYQLILFCRRPWSCRNYQVCNYLIFHSMQPIFGRCKLLLESPAMVKVLQLLGILYITCRTLCQLF